MKILHIEPSSRCTLACPQCPRTEYIDRIVPEDCDIDVIARACRDFDTVIMCGNHGDPIYHHDFHGLIDAIRLSNPTIGIRIVTNGAFRSEEWWKTTAGMLNSNRDFLTFSIDGLPTNNHLYRVNSKWPSIETAIRTVSALNPDLTLIWKWILFKYNERDICDGIDLAAKLGIKKFNMVSSVRYEPDHWLTPTQSYDEIKQETIEWYKSHRAVSKAE